MTTNSRVLGSLKYFVVDGANSSRHKGNTLCSLGMLESVCLSVCCGMARASASQQIVVLGGDHHESGGLEPRRHLAWPLLASPGLSVCQCVHGLYGRELPATTSTATAVH